MTAIVTVRVACISCGEGFSPTLHPGLVRCSRCEASTGLRLPGAGSGPGTVTVLDAPPEAWI